MHITDESTLSGSNPLNEGHRPLRRAHVQKTTPVPSLQASMSSPISHARAQKRFGFDRLESRYTPMLRALGPGVLDFHVKTGGRGRTQPQWGATPAQGTSAAQGRASPQGSASWGRAAGSRSLPRARSPPPPGFASAPFVGSTRRRSSSSSSSSSRGIGDGGGGRRGNSSRSSGSGSRTGDRTKAPGSSTTKPANGW